MTKLAEINEEKFMECYRKGMNHREVATKCGVSKSTYTKWCIELKSKIIRMSIDGKTTSQIMKILDLSYAQVHHCLDKPLADTKKERRYIAEVSTTSTDTYVETGRVLPPIYPPKPLETRVNKTEAEQILAIWGINEQPKYSLSDAGRYKAKKEADHKHRESFVERLEPNNLYCI